MPEFTNPFIGVVPGRKMTESELLRALRLDLSAEEEAVHIYLSHADATDHELAKKVLQDVAEEERVHKGEFQRLINLLSKEEEGFLAEGADEVNAMAAGKEPPDQTAPAERPTKGPTSTIGDLKGQGREG
ncbi:MAG: Rubrerythrin [Planctomycetes bacterium]|nr:Rubrerythrin [Planctomycetota bacterium]